MQTVTRNLQQRIPIYKASFKQSAQQNNLDWQFLAAIGYQESYLNPHSVSPTGVRGVRMRQWVSVIAPTQAKVSKVELNTLI